MIRRFANFTDAVLDRVVPKLSAHALQAAGCSLKPCSTKFCTRLCCPNTGCGPCECSA